MNQYCFLNGEIMSLAEAKVSILDIGLLRGYGIYDGLAVINSKPLRFADHWQRFVRGARALNIKVPITEELAQKKITEIVDKSGFSNRINVRMILTGGQAIGGVEYNFQEPTFYMVAEEWESLPKENYENGTKLITYSYKREMPKLKTTNYIMAVNLQGLKKEQGAVEILYIHNSKVFECATSNIFLVKNNTLITPEIDVLEGITRKIVLELAEENYKIKKRGVHDRDLKSADEVFITSSFKDIVPVIEIDDFTVNSGKVGRVTKDLMDRLAQYIRLQTI